MTAFASPSASHFHIFLPPKITKYIENEFWGTVHFN